MPSIPTPFSVGQIDVVNAASLLEGPAPKLDVSSWSLEKRRAAAELVLETAENMAPVASRRRQRLSPRAISSGSRSYGGNCLVLRRDRIRFQLQPT